MSTFRIDNSEWDALFGEPAELFKVYCALRRVMDYRTGIVGLNPRINEQFFRDALYVMAKRGRHTDRQVNVTRGKIRHLLEALITLGCLERRETLGPFVFFLPKAHRDSCAPKMSNPTATRSESRSAPTRSRRAVGDKESHPADSVGNSAIHTDCATPCQPHEAPDHDAHERRISSPPPESGLPEKTPPTPPQADWPPHVAAPEKKAGGGGGGEADKKEEKSSEEEARSTPLYYPPELAVALHPHMERLVRATPNPQELLDELAGAMSATTVRHPLAYLRTMANKAQLGFFMPELGITIAERRRQALQRQAEIKRYEASQHAEAAQAAEATATKPTDPALATILERIERKMKAREERLKLEAPPHKS